jgi:hypothetical protein
MVWRSSRADTAVKEYVLGDIQGLVVRVARHIPMEGVNRRRFRENTLYECQS